MRRIAALLISSGLWGCASFPQGPADGLDSHGRLAQLCSQNPTPSDAEIATPLGLSTHEVRLWRRARALDPDQVCRLSAAQLARSLSRAGLVSAGTGGNDAREFNEGFFRSDDGSVREDGKFFALLDREVLLAPEAKAGGVTRQSWVSLGPERLGGRMRALLFDRTDPSRIFVGSATGGIWVSPDAGASWSSVDDFSASLSISSITQSVVNPDVLYATTGEWSAGFRGAGLLKSSDRGRSWALLGNATPAATTNWRYSQSIAIDPANESSLVASNWCGVARSDNGGSIWTRVFTNQVGSEPCNAGFRVVFHPTTPSIVLAGLTGRSVARSTDGGRTFARVQLGTVPANLSSGVVDIGVARSNPSVWYASVNENSGDVYRSTDSGATWAKVSNPAHLGTQGDYGNVIWVDPTNESRLVVGGIDLFRSADGGLTWTKISDWTRGYRSGGAGGTDVTVSAHADHHVIVEAPGYDGAGNRRVYFGNDGGLYRQSDIGTAAPTQGWAPLTTGMRTTQFYRVSAKALPAGLAVYGGTQDNFWQYLAPGSASWVQPTTGDGGPGFFDPQNSERLYASIQFQKISRWNPPTVFGGLICQGITEVSKSCSNGDQQYTNFIAPFVVNPLNGEQILAGAASLWLTENARSAATPAWRVVKPAQTSNGTPTNFISAIAQRVDSPQAVFVGHNNGELYSTTNVLAASPIWARRDVAGMPARRVSQIVIDPIRPNRVFALYGSYEVGNIWASDDGGVTWRNLATGLPAAPVYALAVRPGVASTLYAGTEVGLFASEDSGVTWSTTNDGPAAVAVRDLEFADSRTLVAATFGRGIWKASLDAPASIVDHTGLWWGGITESGWGINFTQQGNTLFGTLFTYDASGNPLWLVMSDGRRQGTADTFSGVLYRTDGPVFNAVPFNPGQVMVTPQGTMSVAFQANGTGTLTYTFNGVTVTKTIVRQIYGTRAATCSGTTGSRVGLTNYQDLWWNPAESGWGINLTHQDQTLFGTLFTYDAAGNPLWLVMSAGLRQADGSYYGELYRTRGPAFNANPFNPSQVTATPVGAMRLSFANGESGTLVYSVNGAVVTKSITRQVFASPLPGCAS